MELFSSFFRDFVLVRTSPSFWAALGTDPGPVGLCESSSAAAK